MSANFNSNGRSDLAIAGYNALGSGRHRAAAWQRRRDVHGLRHRSIWATSICTLLSRPTSSTETGRPDLAIAVVNALGQGGIDVLLGKGDGTFRAPVSVSLGSVIPVDLVSADFNSNGRTDLAVAGQDRVTGHIDVTVVAGNGDSTFRASEPIDLGASFLEGLLTGDFNGDGRPDLAVASGSDPSLIRILLGNVDGTFPRTRHVRLHGVGAADRGGATSTATARPTWPWSSTPRPSRLDSARATAASAPPAKYKGRSLSQRW